MSNSFGEPRAVVARKPHRCEWCYEPILKGESHQQFKGMWEGDWQNWRMHQECFDAYEPDDDGGFMSGEGTRPPKVTIRLEGV